MIDDTIKEHGKKQIQNFIDNYIALYGYNPTNKELCIYRLGLSTGINIAGLCLVCSDIDFNKENY